MTTFIEILIATIIALVVGTLFVNILEKCKKEMGEENDRE